MENEKQLIAYDPITFESFTRHATKHRESYDHYDIGYTDAVCQIEDWLDVNTVDAVEVVRCGECKHFRHNLENETYCYLVSGLSDPKEDDFCSYGERKDNTE